MDKAEKSLLQFLKMAWAHPTQTQMHLFFFLVLLHIEMDSSTLSSCSFRRPCTNHTLIQGVSSAASSPEIACYFFYYLSYNIPSCGMDPSPKCIQPCLQSCAPSRDRANTQQLRGLQPWDLGAFTSAEPVTELGSSSLRLKDTEDEIGKEVILRGWD